MFQKQKLVIPPDLQPALAEEGLRYVSDARPGFSRKRTGKSFAFFDQQGKRISDSTVIQRIKSIGVPPAYERVWICPLANGHIQATGFDAKNRKQYRYHVKWRQLRDLNKYEHILQFAKALPAIRRRVASDLRRDGLPREKILATVVSLLEKTLIRVGNAEYAKQNESYGLTTMRRKHVDVSGATIKFHFMGKSGKEWNLALHDKRIAAIVKRCAELPGHELFKYVDGQGARHEIGSADVNGYLQDITQQDFTAKDFRTWSGTVLAAMALSEFEKYDSEAQAKKNIVAAIEHVSKQLGNTPAICRKCYVHPEIVSAYLAGDLATMIDGEIAAKFQKSYRQLSKDEIVVLGFLHQRLAPLKLKKKKA